MEFGESAAPVTPSAPSKPAEKKDLGQVDITYQAFTDRWWPPVTNKADWAGKGDNVSIKWLAIKVSKGSIRCRVYTRKNGWLPYLTFGNSYDLNDKKNGILGDVRRFLLSSCTTSHQMDISTRWSTTEFLYRTILTSTQIRSIHWKQVAWTDSLEIRRDSWISSNRGLSKKMPRSNSLWGFNIVSSFCAVF